MKVTKCAIILSASLTGLLGGLQSAWAGRYVATKNPIPNRYIVILKGSGPAEGILAENNPVTEAKKRQITASFGGSITEEWTDAVRGFAVTMTADKARELASDPDIALVEEDAPLSLFATQAAAPWHLDRIDQPQLPLDQLYSFGSTGRGVNAYIIDSGIRPDHVEFIGNRVKTGYSLVNDGRGTNDCYGHGTHVAGIVGGATYGLAKEINLYPVRVFDCGGSGTNSKALSALDWVARNHVKPAVVNMSLGGAATSMTTAVENLIREKGITVVVAAGNASADACYTSPANAPSAITVAASTSSDARAGFSNWGTCVDIFAPGMMVTSAWKDSPSATRVMNGTSMAAPVVAGVVGRMLSQVGTLTPEEVWNQLRDSSTVNLISDVRGSPNRLVYVPGDGASPPPPQPPQEDMTPPTVSMVVPTDGQMLNSSVVLAAMAQDNAGISKVEFYASSSQTGVNDILLGSSNSPVDANGRYELNWNSQGLANGAYALWSKAFDTSQNTSLSSIANVTIFNSIPDTCNSTSQVLVNTGFEAGRVPWIESSSNRQPIIVRSSERRSGAWAARLRGRATAGMDSVGQNVLIPADVCNAKLDFWFKKIKSNSNARPIRGLTSNDLLRVEAVVVSQPGKPVTLLAEYREADVAANVYQGATFDLSPFKGQTLEIRFRGIEDNYEATTFWLDDVSLNVVK